VELAKSVRSSLEAGGITVQKFPGRKG
jgi:hypothetical protein